MSRLLAVAALAAAAFVFGSAAMAKAPPPGSYRDTCRDLYVEADTLYGECKTAKGKWKKTWISGYEFCDGDIVNRGGILDCDGGRKVDYSRPAPPPAKGDLPPGGWVNDCRDAVIDGYVLRATCRDNQGTWRPTWIDTRQCRDGVFEIDDGFFVCVAAPPPPLVEPMKDLLPSGPWTENCRSGAVKQFQMRAECFAGGNQWLITDLDLRKCKRNNVAAPDGRLRCN